MKVSKRCPKCESTEMIRVEGTAGPYGTGNNIAIGATIFLMSKYRDMFAVSADTPKSGLILRIFQN